MKNICFAYYGDDKFLGWYGDSFGSIVKSSPKIYRNSKEQLEVISKNFNYKLRKLREKSQLGLIDIRLGIIDSGVNEDKDILSNYEDVELRLVECPEYDGTNPDFNRGEYETKYEEQTVLLKAFLSENDIDWNDGPSLLRSNLVDKFYTTNPRVKCDNWIYADYDKVREWASVEPTEFLDVIKKEELI